VARWCGLLPALVGISALFSALATFHSELRDDLTRQYFDFFGSPCHRRGCRCGPSAIILARSPRCCLSLISSPGPVHALYLADQVVLHIVASPNQEQLLRADRTLADLVAGT